MRRHFDQKKSLLILSFLSLAVFPQATRAAVTAGVWGTMTQALTTSAPKTATQTTSIAAPLGISMNPPKAATASTVSIQTSKPAGSTTTVGTSSPLSTQLKTTPVAGRTIQIPRLQEPQPLPTGVIDPRQAYLVMPLRPKPAFLPKISSAPGTKPKTGSMTPVVPGVQPVTLRGSL